METIRFGVIGVGMMGSEHLRNLAALPGATVTAIFDPYRPSLASKVQGRQGAELSLSERNARTISFHASGRSK